MLSRATATAATNWKVFLIKIDILKREGVLELVSDAYKSRRRASNPAVKQPTPPSTIMRGVRRNEQLRES